MIVAAALAAGPALAAGLAVRVVAPDGLLDATARVACLEPASEPVAIDAAGRATLPAGCVRAQCVSRRWLAGDVVEGTCTLAPAVVLEIAMPASAHGEFAVRLEPKGGRDTPIDATMTLAEGASRSPLSMTPVAPGGYVLGVRRAGSAWTCSSEPLTRQPERLRVIIPWRDAVIQKGRLTNARGEPLPQVPVEARLPWNGEFRSTGSWACASVPAAPASSTAGGAFELPVDPDVETMILAGGWDHPKGIAARFRRGAAAEPMSLVVKPAYRLEARVLDDKGAPLACRTEIGITDMLDGIVAFTVPGSARKGTCGPDGKIKLGPLLHPAYELAVYPEEALPVRRRDTADRPVTDLGVIRVDRGGSLSVEVHDVEGNPVSGAEVSASNRQGEIVKRTARTAAAGLVTLRGLPRDTPIDVRVRAKDYATHDKPGVEADGARVAVVLSRGGTLRGKVLTPEGGVPRHGSITWKLEGDKPPSVDLLAEDGTFVIDPPPGPVDVHASAPGFASSVPVRVEIPADQAPPDLELTLRERDLLRGRVVDPDGRPVPGATVVLLIGSLNDPPEIGSQASVISGADGEFTLPEPERGQGVAASLKGYAPGTVRYAPEMRDRVELKLGRPAALRIKLPDALAENGSLELRDGGDVRRGVFARSRTDFVVEDLWPPRVQVTLANGPEKVVELVAGETAVADFRSVGRVLGRVMYKGRAIARAAVINLQQTPRGEVISSTTLTDDDGRFELESVAAGRQRIIAHAAEGRADAQVTMPEGGDLSLDLELSDARLDLLVTDAKTGAPVSGAKIVGKIPGAACWGVGYVRQSADQGGYNITFTQFGCVEGTSGVDGTVSLPVPNPGSYDVSVRAQDYEPWTAKMKLGQDIVPVRAELVRGSLPRVRVTLESDPPGVEGLFYCGQGVKRTQVAAKADGVCEGFDPGAIVIAFRSPGYGFARATVTVPERGDAEVTLKVPRGGDLVIPVAGKDAGVAVLDSRGEVINMLGRQDYPECDYLTDAEGKVSHVCRVLPPGTYKIMTYGQHRGTAVVRPGETTVFY